VRYLGFQQEHTYRSHRVTTVVRLLNPPIPVAVNAILDTGASISTFDKALLPVLGVVDVTTGRQIRVTVANNQSDTAYVHPGGAGSWDIP